MYFSLTFFKNVIILHATNAQHVLDCILTKTSAKSYLCLITKLLKMVKTIIILSLCVSDLLMQFGNIEVNPGPKYSFLTFLTGIKTTSQLMILGSCCFRHYPFKHQFHKMVKHTQTICWQIPDELFECV